MCWWRICAYECICFLPSYGFKWCCHVLVNISVGSWIMANSVLGLVLPFMLLAIYHHVRGHTDVLPVASVIVTDDQPCMAETFPACFMLWNMKRVWLVQIVYPDCTDLFWFVGETLEAIQACLGTVYALSRKIKHWLIWESARYQWRSQWPLHKYYHHLLILAVNHASSR